MSDTGEHNYTERKLAAIMFTDIVGYTSLMGKDEQLALRILGKNKANHENFISQYNGKLLKEMGDGNLAIFNSVSEAVQCAAELQKISIEDEIKLKIGIHQGEVVLKDNDVFGDGVNIASRIEPLGSAGTILLSDSAFKNIKNKEGIDAELLGNQSLKNVDEAVGIYVIRKVRSENEELKVYDYTGGITLPTTGKSRNKRSVLISIVSIVVILAGAIIYYLSGLSSEKEGPISLVVLPFHYALNDENKNYGLGLATEIRSKLSQSKNFDFITSMQAAMRYSINDSPIDIGKELGVKYILSGIYQIAGERIKVDVELIDTESGAGVWNLSFNELFSNIFMVQSKIAGKVFNEFAMTDNQIEEKPTENLEAYRHYLRGLEMYLTQRDQDFYFQNRAVDAEEQLRLAIAKDSTYLDAFVVLHGIKIDWLNNNRFNLPVRQSEEFAKVMEEATNIKEYVELHFSDSWESIFVIATQDFLVNQDFEEFAIQMEEVLTYDPENSDAHSYLGFAYRRLFNLEKSILHTARVIRQNPADGLLWSALSEPLVCLGDYASAELAIQKAIEMEQPSNSPLAKFIFYDQGKPYRGANPLVEGRSNHYYKGDFEAVISLYDTANYSEPESLAEKLWRIPPESSYYWKAFSYYHLGNSDSVKHYGQLYLNSIDQNPSHLRTLVYAIMGEKENAMSSHQQNVAIFQQSVNDKMISAISTFVEIEALTILGEYEQATELLAEIFREFPQANLTGRFYNWPIFKKIKSEYPPFEQALNNRVLPPRTNLEGLLN